MSYVIKLECSRCHRAYEPSENPVMCESGDMGRLDIYYDYERMKEILTRKTLGERRETDVWRWRELLPVDEDFAVRLGEGGTPLLRAERLGEKYDIPNLYLKDETRNPTASFKDRSMAISVAKAREIGVRTAVTASSGNAAAALAAYAARAGMTVLAFVLHTASDAKVAQLKLYGAKVVKVKGVERGKDPTVEMMLEAVRRYGLYPSPSFGPFNPYQVEGPKTISYELAMDLDWVEYGWLLAPTGSGCLAAGLWKGLRDLVELDLVSWYPRLVPVQPEGNSPLARAIMDGLDFTEIEPEGSPRTIATGLSDPYPWDGDAAMEGVRRTGGRAAIVGDDEIVDAMKDLARYEGVFAEPSGSAAVAAAKRLREDGVIDRGDRVVALVTGSGLKDLAFTSRILGSTLEVGMEIKKLGEIVDQLLGNS